MTQTRDYYLRNRNAYLERQKHYYQTHRAERQTYNKAWYDLNKEHASAYMKGWHMRNKRARSEKERYRYSGWTAEMYHQALINQAGLCDKCGKPMRNACADHNHSTGQQRSLLCSGCNHNLDYFENLEIRAPYEAYLKRWSV